LAPDGEVFLLNNALLAKYATKKALQIKLEYLMGLQEEIAATIRQVQEQLAELPQEKK
jgi:hypothetical protein